MLTKIEGGHEMSALKEVLDGIEEVSKAISNIGAIVEAIPHFSSH